MQCSTLVLANMTDSLNAVAATSVRVPRAGACVALILGILGLAFITPAQADIYSRLDESGSLTLSNYSTDKRDTLLLKSVKEQASDNTATAADASGAAAYAPLLTEAARRHEVDAALLHAVITAESAYNAKAVSLKGAAGLMQLMPATAQRLGVTDVYDPAQNILAGAKYLKELLQRFDNDLPLTLAAYNAGENAVARYGNRIPPYRETRGYVTRVLKLYQKRHNPLP